MNRLIKTFNSIQYRHAVPVALFLTAIAAYGIFFWQMGFHWDDLPISWIRYELGTEALDRYFSEVRPAWAMLYRLTTGVIPQVPAYWQVFAILLRWLTAVTLWALMTELLPQRRVLAFALSALMLVYPGFNQQWASFVYAHFFIVFLCFLLSWYLMLRRKVLLALLFSALNLWMLEYFFFLELARPIILWISLRDEPLLWKERLVRVLKAWVPYLIVFAAAIVYRLFVFNHPGFGYSLSDEISKAPMQTILLLFQRILSSLWTVAVAAWSQVFRFPNPTVDGSRTSLLYALIVVAMGLLMFWLLFFRKEQEGGQRKSDSGWLILLGAASLFLGGIPYWLTNLPVSLEFPASRATLSFMLGACFVLVGLIDLLPQRLRYALVVVLVSLSVGRQFLWATEFRRDWGVQRELFWQMTWRAPGLKPDTLVLINEKLNYSADNSIGALLNWVYAPKLSGEQIPYALFYPTNRLGGSLPALEPDLAITFPYEAGKFHGNTSDAVAFYFAPPACLRLLDPALDVDNRYIPEESLMRQAAALSDPERVLATQEALMPAIYGPEPAHGWCYYFEKAELARQFGEWETVTRLGDDAFALDDYPNNPVERFVFIEGYAHMGRWKRALELSDVSYRVSKDFVGPLLCRLWERIETETFDSVERSEALSEVQNRFACNP